MAIAAVAIAVWWLATLATVAPPPGAAAVASAAVEGPAVSAASVGTTGGAARTAASVAPAVDLRAELTGFCGRIVDAAARPVPAAAVAVYRGGFDQLLGAAAAGDHGPAVAPDFCVGTASSDAAGRFTIAGILPRGSYLLRAVAAAGATVQSIAIVPTPGELVELGDIAVANAAIVGSVVDGDGAALAGARVRFLRATAFAEAPLPPWSDPDGTLLARTPDAVPVVAAPPAWWRAMAADLLVAEASSDARGRFELTGAAIAGGAGGIVVATHGGCAPASVRVDDAVGDAVRTVGIVALGHGVPLCGRIVDADGLPLAGAAFVAGNTAANGDVDVARCAGTTDASGRFRADDLGPGDVTIAVQRRRGDVWWVGAPMANAGEVQLALPAAHALCVRVLDAAGNVVRAPRLELVAGARRGDRPELAAAGLLPALDLTGRCAALADGRVRIAELLPGNYAVDAGDGAGARAGARAGTLVRIGDDDLDVTIRLAAEVPRRVRVVGPGDAAIADAAVWVQDHGVGGAPFAAGRTAADGWLSVRGVGDGELTVSAAHPRWGTLHGRLDDRARELVLRAQSPGRIDVQLRDRGRSPSSAAFVVRAWSLPAVRGPLPEGPLDAAPSRDGAATLPALQPGRYRVAVVRAPAGWGTFAFVAAGSERRVADDLPSAEVEVVAGAATRVDLDLATMASDGPAAHVRGTVECDGRLGAGCRVTMWSAAVSRTLEVDALGNFEFDRVPAGAVELRVCGPGVADAAAVLWSRRLAIRDGEEWNVAVVVATSSIAGSVVHADGSPAIGVQVQAHRTDAAVEGDDASRWFTAATDAVGGFRFGRLPIGDYRLAVHTAGDPGFAAVSDHVLLTASGPETGVLLALQPEVVVAGHVELDVFPRQPDHLGMSFVRVRGDGDGGGAGGAGGGGADDRPAAFEVVAADGSFAARGLEPGRYRVTFTVRLDDWIDCAAAAPIDVPSGGLRGLIVRPVCDMTGGMRR